MEERTALLSLEETIGRTRACLESLGKLDLVVPVFSFGGEYPSRYVAYRIEHSPPRLASRFLGRLREAAVRMGYRLRRDEEEPRFLEEAVLFVGNRGGRRMGQGLAPLGVPGGWGDLEEFLSALWRILAS